MRVCFAAYDLGPRANLELIAKKARDLGHEVVVIPSEKILNPSSAGVIAISDVLVTGLASFETEADLLAASCALYRSVPWVVFEDVPGACRRPKAQALIEKSSAVILAHPAEEFRQQAVEFGYRPEVLTYLGPPPQWRVDYEVVQEAISQNLREKVYMVPARGGDLVNVPQSSRIIGLIGGKDPAINNKVLRLIAEAIAGQSDFAIAFSQHPRERAEKPEQEAMFARAMDERMQILHNLNQVMVKHLKGAEVVGLADIMIYAGGATNSISGAMLQRCQIYYEDDTVRARMRDQQNGWDTWFVTEMGGAIKAHTPEGLGASLKVLTTLAGKEMLARNQTQSFPVPADWDTETKIVRFLENLVRK